MNLNGRVNRLENKAGGDKPWLSLEPVADKPGFYQGSDNAEYSEADLEELGQHYNLVLITWADRDSPDTPKGFAAVDVSWGDPDPPAAAGPGPGPGPITLDWDKT